MAGEVVMFIQRSVVFGFLLFILVVIGYLLGFHKSFILLKYKKKIGEAKVFMATLDQQFPPSPTMDPHLREERVRRMIKSGFPMVVLEKAQQLINQDKRKEAKQNGLQLQKNKSTGTGTGTTGSTANNSRTASGIGSIGGNKEPQQSGVLPISQAPIRGGEKPNSQWNWRNVKQNRTSN